MRSEFCIICSDASRSSLSGSPRNSLFCLLPRSASHVVYFEARSPALLFYGGWVVNSGPSSGYPRKQTPIGRFLTANHEMLEGDTSQNAASGKPTVFASTSESALAKSG